MARVEELSKGVAEWLDQRLNTAPNKLTNLGEVVDAELVGVLSDLTGTDASINLTKVQNNLP